MQCPHCQADNQQGRFCVKCGQPLAETLPLNDPDNEEALSTETVDTASLSESRMRKMKIAALVCGILLAMAVGFFLVQHFFFTKATPNTAASSNIEEADIVSPEDGVVSDSIVGHWRHYNTGIVIEKIGSDHYRWKSGKTVHEMRFKEGQYVLTNEGNKYFFMLDGPDRLKLQSNADANGRLVKKPLFPTGYAAGRVGQDGSPAKNLYVNKDAFDIVGRTYGELAGFYGPGAVSVINDHQYIVFRGTGGNFAVQFSGSTVPLAEKGQEYKIVKLSATTTIPETTEPSNNNSTTTTPSTPSVTNENNSTKTDSTTTKDEKEKKDYRLEIPDMPSFPSNSAVATGVVWADLGFLVANAPQTMTVENLSAILKIPLEVGDAPSNASGYTFYGMNEGYFAGVYTMGNHQFRISGYGNSDLNKDKTTIFIEQLS